MSGLLADFYNEQHEDEHNEKQIAAILEGIELIESRIRFSKEFLSFLENCTEDEWIALHNKELAPILFLNQTEDLLANPIRIDTSEYRKKLKEGTLVDIKHLEVLHSVLKDSLHNRRYILKLCSLISQMEYDELDNNNKDQMIGLFDTAEKKLESSIAKLKKSYSKKKDSITKNEIANKINKLEIIRKHRKQFLEYKKSMTELETIERLKDIILKNSVTNLMENSYNKYIKTNKKDGKMFLSYSEKHAKLFEDNSITQKN